MNKKLFAGLMVVALVCSVGVANAFATTGTKEKTPGERHSFSTKRNLTDEQKAQMKSAREEYKEKLDAFVNSLTDEQKALYDAMRPGRAKFDRPARRDHTKFDRATNTDRSDGRQRRYKSDEAAVTVMKEKREAFIASLNDNQKAAYDEIMQKPMGRGSRGMKRWQQ